MTANTRVISRLYEIVDSMVNTRLFSRANTKVNLMFSIKDCIKTRIDFGPLELWELHGPFSLRSLLRKPSISALWNSASSTAHFY